MDIKRIILYAALALISYSLWTHWQVDFPVKPQSASVIVTGSEGSLLSLPQTDNAPYPSPIKPVYVNQEPTRESKTIHVTTDVLDLIIDLQQGDITQANLLNYPLNENQKNTPFTLLNNKPNDRYLANSSLMMAKDHTMDNLDFNFNSPRQEYRLADDQASLVVTLSGQTPDNVLVTKEFMFTKGSYLINMRYLIDNKGTTDWKGYLNTQLLRTAPEEDKSSMFHIGSFTGASYSNPGKHRYQKVSFKDMGKTNLDVDAHGGWVAMQQHYFLSAWVPDAKDNNRLYTRALTNGDYIIGAVSPAVTVAPSAQLAIGARLYVGPEITSLLKPIAPGLDLTVDYGWLWFLSSLLFSLMGAIYSVVGNWGFSIVLVTVLIKLAFYRLSATSYKSMANMRRLQPKLQALRERYGDDKAKMSQATMTLYREEKVNPLGGCLPIVIQIPVFIALYWVLLESVELRQAPFILWITDLAAADPYHVLPIIMGATMLIQQRLNPAPPDPMQAKIMMMLPLFFTALFWGFPSGLVLYWIVNNTLSILQQWYITRKYSDDKPK